jgi:hypothetical protein
MQIFVIGRTIQQTPKGGVWEVMGVFDDEQRAVEACKPGEWIGPLGMNGRTPDGPQPWPGAYYPHAPKWTRHCFKVNALDYRPMAFPPPGPYWCSGHGEGFAQLVAYLPAGENLRHWWPDAHDVESEPRNEIRFTEIFPQPDWWK